MSYTAKMMLSVQNDIMRGHIILEHTYRL